MRGHALPYRVTRQDGLFNCYLMACHQCGREDRLPAPKTMPPESVVNKFRKRGWDAKKNSERATCPGCGAAKAANGKGNGMTKPNSVAGIPNSVAGIPMGPAMAKAQRKVFALLEDNFDEAAGRYRGDWSDGKVSKETGVSTAAVVQWREGGFGPLRAPPEIEALRGDLDAVKGLLADIETRLDQTAKRYGEG